MRRYAVPLLIFAALGAILVVYVRSQGTGPDRDDDASGRRGKESSLQPKTDGSETLRVRGERNTPTPLQRHKWLSELERVLQRDDLSNAYFYRTKILEDIDTVLADETLYRNLMAAIRKYAIESDDLEKRNLLFPMLRMITTAESTRIIEEEYYKARTESERLSLMLAMADPRHNPPVAVPWVVEMAINSEDGNNRQLALDSMADLKDLKEEGDPTFAAARQIYEGSTRPRQRERALETVSRSAHVSRDAQKYIREKLRNPREEEFGLLLMSIDAWGSHEDAEFLKSLANEFPASARELREHAKRIRRHRLAEEGKVLPPEGPEHDPQPEEEEPGERGR